jgi:phage N-6-adenine-methyltransferase
MSLTTAEDIRGRSQVGRPLRSRNLSGQGGQVPPLEQLLSEGQVSHRRIRKIDTDSRRFRKDVLIEWLNQAERLWIAAEIHKLKGKHFEVFAAQIGIDRSSAYELLKLHPNREQALARCDSNDHWPGWEVCASWFKGHDDAQNGEPDAPISLNRGILSPTWHRYKVVDDEYGTPQSLFDHYNRIHQFTCDVASSEPLSKCKHYFTKEVDGLRQSWVGVCWLNPPYSDISPWVKKAYESAQQGAIVVALLPAFTDTLWFHDYASHGEIEILKGRLMFAHHDIPGHAPCGHVICVFRKRSARVGKRLKISLNGHRLGTASR